MQPLSALWTLCSELDTAVETNGVDAAGEPLHANHLVAEVLDFYRQRRDSLNILREILETEQRSLGKSLSCIEFTEHATATPIPTDDLADADALATLKQNAIVSKSSVLLSAKNSENRRVVHAVVALYQKILAASKKGSLALLAIAERDAEISFLRQYEHFLHVNADRARAISSCGRVGGVLKILEEELPQTPEGCMTPAPIVDKICLFSETRDAPITISAQRVSPKLTFSPRDFQNYVDIRRYESLKEKCCTKHQ